MDGELKVSAGRTWLRKIRTPWKPERPNKTKMKPYKTTITKHFICGTHRNDGGRSSGRGSKRSQWHRHASGYARGDPSRRGSGGGILPITGTGATAGSRPVTAAGGAGIGRHLAWPWCLVEIENEVNFCMRNRIPI